MGPIRSQRQIKWNQLYPPAIFARSYNCIHVHCSPPVRALVVCLPACLHASNSKQTNKRHGTRKWHDPTPSARNHRALVALLHAGWCNIPILVSPPKLTTKIIIIINNNDRLHWKWLSITLELSLMIPRDTFYSTWQYYPSIAKK